MVIELSLADVEQNKHRVFGNRLRAACPIHGSDHQLSLSVDLTTGAFHCFSCGAKGKLTDFWDKATFAPPFAGQVASPARPSLRSAPGPPLPLAQPTSSAILARRGTSSLNTETALPAPTVSLLSGKFSSETLAQQLKKRRESLPGSPAVAYLEQRGIELKLAQAYGAGYAADGKMAGRVLFPLEGPLGLLNIYGRAISPAIPKEQRHRFLPGPKGLFNYAALARYDTIHICEGVFDCLSLIAAGYPNAIALCGARDFRVGWFRNQERLIFCLDADTTGQESTRLLACEALSLGIKVFYLPAAALQNCKDLNELWSRDGRLAFHLPARSSAQENSPLADLQAEQKRLEQDLTSHFTRLQHENEAGLRNDFLLLTQLYSEVCLQLQKPLSA